MTGRHADTIQSPAHAVGNDPVVFKILDGEVRMKMDEAFEHVLALALDVISHAPAISYPAFNCAVMDGVTM